MHSLKHELIIVTLQVQNAFHAKEPVSHLLDYGAEPDAHLQAIELAGALHAHGFDVLQVIVVVMVVMSVLMPIM